MTTEHKGSCLCGGIQITFTGAPKKNFICYCSDCRKGSGHLGQFISQYDSDDVKVTDKDSNLKEFVVTATKSGFPKRKQYCGGCGSTILTLPMKHNGEVAMVRPSLLDSDFSQFAPNLGIFGDVKTEYTKGCETDEFF
ncbi:Mss4-like protein [Scheffersomyces coipomensis]|uniref:Mss4-like protein n=1 Tax=Scheffersomyces coipomensis TaxID=1788519 RepID=UPI00315C90E1